ncbi:MAG: hypothetical protein HY726_18885 [Candidatus Rokubacteria bacterium]|nr:hypothetical protein [Candidatus Rokubacteria bacterium]
MPRKRDKGNGGSPGVLVCDRINLNESGVGQRLLEVLQELVVSGEATVRELRVVDRYYFSVSGPPIAAEPGWYIICDGAHRPLYVGTAGDLNYRLNDQEGTLDGFAAWGRLSDPERNFIKRLVSNGFLDTLSAVIVPERKLRTRLNIEAPLSKRDRANVEKFLNIFRSHVVMSRVKPTGQERV